MPDEKVLAHRLSSLFEGLWLSPQVAQTLREAKIDPKEFQAACRERLRQIADDAKAL